MDNVSIQKAELADVDRLLPLIKNFLNYHSSLDSSYFESYDEMGANNVRDQISGLLNDESVAIFYAQYQDTIIGYAVGQIDEGEEVSKLDRIGKIIDLYVLPEHRGKKAGTKILSSVIEWFKSRNITRAELSVYTVNKDSVSIWERLGYQEFERKMFRNI
jgi:GNAT superfamily N-acetyltransferase